MDSSASIKIESYRVKKSQSEHFVPEINGIHLHSIYNPVKEAEEFAKRHLPQITNGQNYLILGLGFGYHIQQMITQIEAIHGVDNYQIFVIEPSQFIAEEAYKHNEIKSDRVSILTFRNIEEYYRHKDFLDFLLQVPTVITHPASYNLFNGFYKDFLTYQSSSKIGDIKTLCQCKLAKICLNQIPDDIEIQGLPDFLAKNSISEQASYFFNFYNQV